MSVNMGTAVAFLELDTSKFSKGFTSAKDDLKVFLDTSATAGQKLNGLGNAMQTVGGIATKTLTVPLVGVGLAAMKVSTDFEAGMSNVKAVSGATGTEFEKLRQRAIDLGASTTFSATEVADAMTEMAKAGWGTSEIMSGMEGVLNAASASGEGLAVVAGIVADAITGFGMSAKDSTKVADLLAQSANAGTISVSDLGESFKYVAPIAKTMGLSIEDTVTAITAMSKSGIKGSQAGTALRTMLSSMIKPTDDVAAAMDELGISLTNSDGSFKPLKQTLDEMRTSFSGLTDEQKAYYANVLAGREGMSGLMAILSMSQQEYDKLSDSMKNSAGVAKQTAEVMKDNLKGSVEELGGALETAGINIGEVLTPSFRKITDRTKDLVNEFNDLSDEQQKNIVKWAGLATAIGPVTSLAGKTVGTLGKLGTGFVNVGKETVNFAKAIKYSREGLDGLAKGTSNLYAGLTNAKTGFTNLLTPVGMTTLAIGATAAAITTYLVKTEEKINKMAQETEAEKLLRESIEERYKVYTKGEETTQKAIQNANAEAEATRTLAEKLRGVVDENGRVLAGKEHYAQFLVGELSQALGQEITMNDGVIQNYGELMGTIDQVIEKKKALAVQESMSEAYSEAVKNQTNAQLEYANQLQVVFDDEQRVEEVKKKVAKAQQDYNEALKISVDAAEGYKKPLHEANLELEAAEKKLKKSEKALKDANDAMVGFNSTVENYEGLSTALISGSAEEIEQALLKVEQGFLTAETATRESLTAQVETIDDKYKRMQEALNAGVEGVTQEMVDNMKALSEQARAELEAKIEQDKQVLTQKFTELGIQAPQSLIDSLMQKDPEVQQSVLNMLTNAKNGTALKKGEIETLFKQLGINAPNELMSQLKGLEPSVQMSAINLLLQLQNAESAKRPEIVSQLRDLGIQMDDNLAGGIESNTGKVVNQAGTVGDKANKEIATKVKPDVEAPKVKEITNASAVGAKARSDIELNFSTPINAIVSVTKVIKEVFDGSHATGLDYVPFNGYVAQLHEGERVLTKQENREYNRGTRNTGATGDTFNFYNTQPTPYEYARQMKRAKRDLLNGF